MHDTAPSRERTLLVGAPRKRTREVKVITEHLDELARLVDTAGASIAGRVVQAVEKPTNDFYIGKGKVQEVAAMVAPELRMPRRCPARPPMKMLPPVAP